MTAMTADELTLIARSLIERGDLESAKAYTDLADAVSFDRLADEIEELKHIAKDFVEDFVERED